MIMQKFANPMTCEDTLPPGAPVQINRGRWTKRERRIFEESFRKYGKEWKLIASLIKTRTVIQIRTHAQKYFQKLAKQTGTPVMSTSKKDKMQPLPPHLLPRLEMSNGAKVRRRSVPRMSESFASAKLSPISILSQPLGQPSKKRKLEDPTFFAPSVIEGQIQPTRVYNFRKECSRKRRGRGISLDQLTGSSSELGSEAGEEPDMNQEDEISKELAFYNSNLGKSNKNDNKTTQTTDSGRITPRMLAAATILMAPHFNNKIPEKRLVWAVNTLAQRNF